MRISEEQRKYIKTLISELRPDASVYLFGSRTDDKARGGDIDILVLCKPVFNFQEKVQLETNFWKKFGEQKIDFVCFERSSKKAFKKLALLKSIPI